MNPKPLARALLASVVLLLASAFAAAAAIQEAKSMQPSDASAAGGKEVITATGLKYIDLKIGDGAEAKPGDTVKVHYTGWLTDGTKFDSSLDRGQPYSFKLGVGAVIKGWDQGVAGMKPGGRRKLVIPPELGYGQKGAAGLIPPGATLVFEVELLSIG